MKVKSKKIKSIAIKAVLVLFVFSLNSCATLAGVALLGVAYGALSAAGNVPSSTSSSTSSTTTSVTSVSSTPAPRSKPLDKSYDSFEQRVKKVAVKARAINDIDNDGETNCCDKALYFYWYWNRYYDEPCELVVNQKKGYLNHMFLRIQYNGKWYCAEPLSNTPLDVKGYWKERYDPAFNIYQKQTDYKWLSDDYVQPVMERLDRYWRT